MALGRESSLEAAGALRAAAPNLGLSWGQCGCHRDPLVRPYSNSNEFHIGGVKSQLLCGARFDLALGSLPYPR